MSSPMDDGVDIAVAREVTSDYVASPYRAAEAAVAEEVTARAERPSVTISLSSEAKVALAGGKDPETKQREAVSGAKEIAAVAGVTEAQALQLAQPKRDPPPAKGAALFQANLTSEKSE